MCTGYHFSFYALCKASQCTAAVQCYRAFDRVDWCDVNQDLVQSNAYCNIQVLALKGPPTSQSHLLHGYETVSFTPQHTTAGSCTHSYIKQAPNCAAHAFADGSDVTTTTMPAAATASRRLLQTGATQTIGLNLNLPAGTNIDDAIAQLTAASANNGTGTLLTAAQQA